MGTIDIEKKDCFGCGSCAVSCPVGAVTMHRDQEGFSYPVFDLDGCVNCGICEKVCPAKHTLSNAEGRCYAVRCNDNELLKKSTSGGAFSLIAQEVIAEGGLICGVCFDEEFHVHHVLSEDIEHMRKSKYVQSNIGKCFGEVKKALAKGKEVLFTGTPCQCHAMKLYCDDYRGKLITAALICRGVQSPGLWEDYVAWLSCDAPLEAYDFRDKRQRNDAHTIAYTVAGEETAVSWGKDKLSRLYNRALTYRPSCYRCPYCSPDNGFDFTLGDFWGIEKIHPELADGRGTSLVIARGEYAERVIQKISGRALVVPCEKKDVLQLALSSPAKEHALRKFLFRDFAKKGKEGHCDIPLILKKYGMV